ncbi:MAG: two-component regulator propeller domain-containing protein [Bryobacteraceae bacterium]
MSQYAREVWSSSNGLPKGKINGITQTSDGYLWIGTEHGTKRFDGASFISLKDPGLDHFAPDRVLGLAADRSAGLWILRQDPTVLRYQNGAFAQMTLRPKVDALVTAMAEGPDGSLLFASRLDGVFKWNGARFETIIGNASLSLSPVTSIAATAIADVWLGTIDNGLLRVRGKAVSRITDRLPGLKVNCLLVGVKDELYVGTNRGLTRWDGARLTQAGLPKSLTESPILAMTKDRDENIWIGTDTGLVRLNSRGVSSLVDANAKPVTALFEDREGDLWVGGADELQQIRERPFMTYLPEPDIAKKPGGPIHADASGRIFAASTNGGLFFLQDGKEFVVPGLKRDEVYSIAGEGDDLWLGRKQFGLTHVAFREGVWSSRNYMQADGLPQNSVYAVHQNRDGTIWAGLVSGGVSHFQNGQFINYTTAIGALASSAVLSIAEGSDGAMWFATSSGLSRLTQDGWSRYGTRDGLPSEGVNTLFLDSSNVLWVGTLEGLAFIRSGKVLVPPGLPTPLLDQILGIAEDHLGSLWITTVDGVFRVDRAGLLSGDLSNGGLREFGVADGIVDLPAIRRERSISTDSRGCVWLSTTSGIVSTDPARLRRIAVPTIVHIGRVIVDGEAGELSASAAVPPAPKRIVIEYAGLNLASPDSVRFRFRLDGYDTQWSPPATTKEAVYTNLGPGPYQFHVVASNEDQEWSKAEATFSFRVAPTLWQNWWFRSAAIGALVLSLLVLYRLRLRQITEQVNNRFEARLAERARIARDLHDTLLQSFHGLMLRFQAVENMLPHKPSQAKDSLAIAIDRAARAITEGREAVQELRSNELLRNDLFETLTSLGHELAASEQAHISPSFQVLVEGAPRQLHPSLKENLYRISREAMINAFRHAQATHIELDIRYGSRVLRLRIRDDGVGMDADILAKGLEGHWGLPGMQERAKAIRGRLEIWSETARGTEIQLEVPASVAYAELKRRPWNL